MVPPGEHGAAPIALRHPLIFYIGHLPAFTAARLAEVLGEPPVEPADWSVGPSLFGRGIDPDVDDPSKCHDHPEVPAVWPPLPQVLAYRDDVRSRLARLYGECARDTGSAAADGGPLLPAAVQHVLWMAFEHEAMHLETFCYLLLQWDRALPPPPAILLETTAGAFGRAMAPAAGGDAGAALALPPPPPPPAALVQLAPATVDVGFTAEAAASGGDAGAEGRQRCVWGFGWDNEQPRRQVHVAACAMQSRPVTVGEYFAFLQARLQQADGAAAAAEAWSQLLPASWQHRPSGGAAAAPEPAGSVSSPGAGCCGGAGAPLLSQPLPPPPGDALAARLAVRSVFGPVSLAAAWRWPVYCSLLQAEAYADAHGMRIPTEPEVLLARQAMDARPSLADEAPTDFGTWAPVDVPLAPPPGGLAQLRSNGWEWTATPLAPHEGFEPHPLYPEYSVDFFDGKHCVLLGGAWCTVRSIAARRTFRNFYQRGYPYMLAKFRLCGAARTVGAEE